MSFVPISPELSAALRRLREVRRKKPQGDSSSEDFAAWRESIADALDSLAILLFYEEDRRRASEESKLARAEAAKIRERLNETG